MLYQLKQRVKKFGHPLLKHRNNAPPKSPDLLYTKQKDIDIMNKKT